MAGVDVTVSEYGMLVAQYLCIVNLAVSANLELWGGGGGGVSWGGAAKYC